MVAKHRRAVFEPGALLSTAESWPEALAYGQVPATAGRAASYARAAPAVNGYFASNAYDAGADDPAWAAAIEGEVWQDEQDWQDWQDWGAPPELHHDHPSAPLPRFQFPADHPSRPMPALRDPGAPDLPRRRPGGSARIRSAPHRRPDAGYDNGPRRLHAVPDIGAVVDRAAPARQANDNVGRHYRGRPVADFADPGRRDMEGFHSQPGPARRDVTGYQRQASPGWQEPADDRRDTGPFGLQPGPANARPQAGSSPSRDSLREAGQVLTLANGQAAQIAQDAQDYAAAIREAAEREAAAIVQQATSRADGITQDATGQAAAIREAAEQQAAELLARLDSMSGELGRVAAYVTENLATPAMPAIAPVRPGTRPALPSAEPVLPDISPTKPDTGPTRPDAAPSRPDTRPGTRTARPDTRPGTRTARPGTAPRTRPGSPGTRTETPTKKGQAQGRQRRAMRIATAGTAALLSIAAIGAVTYTGIHGFSFFVFREGGQGETPGTFLDNNFLARQAAAAQHHDSAPKGRHHKATAG